MRTTFFYLVLFIIPLTGKSQSWVFDAAHSNLQFSVNMVVAEIEGSIKITEASFVQTGDDYANAVITIKGDMSSIDTDNEERDAHLKTADFFDVEQFPNLTFYSTSFKKISETKYTVEGNLTFHGVSRPVMMEVMATTAARSYDGKPIVGFKATGIISRLAYHIGTTTPEAILNDDVHVKGNVIFVKE